MKPQLLFPLAIVLTTVFTLGTSKASLAEPDDGQSIQGVWALVSDQDGGGKKNIPADLTVTITKDKIVFAYTSRPKSELPFKLHSTTTPKSIDLTDRRGDILLGIYELSADTLTICSNDEKGGKRSTSFESKPSSHNDILMIFKRIKP